MLFTFKWLRHDPVVYIKWLRHASVVYIQMIMTWTCYLHSNGYDMHLLFTSELLRHAPVVYIQIVMT